MPTLANIAQTATLCCGVTLAAIVTVQHDDLALEQRAKHSSRGPMALGGRVRAEWTGASNSAIAPFLLEPPSIAHRLHGASRLSISQLAKLMGVSRQTFHNWLSGETISDGNQEKLEKLTSAVEAISASMSLKDFLKKSFYGVSAEHLLTSGQLELAISLSSGSFATGQMASQISPIAWTEMPSDMTISHFYKSETGIVRNESEFYSELYQDEVIAIGNVVVNG